VPSGFRVIGEARQAGDEALLCDEAPVDVSGWDPYRDWDSAAG